MPYRQGDIVEARVPDPYGVAIGHDHPLVVLRDTFDLAPHEPFVAVVISTKFREPIPAHWIAIPYGSGPSRAKTGMTRPCVAKCDWLVEILASDVKRVLGAVPGRLFEEIARKVRELEADGTTPSP